MSLRHQMNREFLRNTRVQPQTAHQRKARGVLTWVLTRAGPKPPPSQGKLIQDYSGRGGMWLAYWSMIPVIFWGYLGQERYCHHDAKAWVGDGSVLQGKGIDNLPVPINRLLFASGQYSFGKVQPMTTMTYWTMEFLNRSRFFV